MARECGQRGGFCNCRPRYEAYMRGDPDWLNIFMASMEVSDVVSDVWASWQAFFVMKWLGVVAWIHLCLIFLLNALLIRSFLHEAQQSSSHWWQNSTDSGAAWHWKALVGFAFFGPRILNILNSNLFGWHFFQLNLAKVRRPIICFSWGVIFEGIPQITFNITQHLLGKKLSDKEQLVLYVSTATSMFTVLTSLAEIMYAAS